MTQFATDDVGGGAPVAASNSYIRFSLDEYNFAKSNFSNLISYLESAKSNIASFISNASTNTSTWVTNYYERFVKYPNYQLYEDGKDSEEYKEDCNTAIGNAQGIVREKVEEFMGICNAMEGKLPNYSLNEIYDIYTNVNNAFLQLETIINNFDKLTPSISENLEKITGVVIDVNADTGIETIYYEYSETNEAGETVYYKVTLSELVNSFYTYVGTTMNNVVAQGLLAQDNGLSYAEMDAMLADTVAANGEFVSNLTYDGFMNVAGQEDIKGLYSSALTNAGIEGFTGNYENDVEQFNTTYTSAVANITEKNNLAAEGQFLTNSVGGVTTAACGLGAGLLGSGAFNLTANLEDYNKKEREKEKKESVDPAVAAEGDPSLLAADGEGSEPIIIPEQNQAPTTNSSPVVQPSEGVGSGQPTGGEPLVEQVVPEEPVTPVEPVTPTEPVEPVEPVGGEEGTGSGGQETYVPEFVEPVRTEIPKEMPEVADITPEEVDAQAQEAYYEKYGDDLGEHRAELSTEFEELFMKEDKTELVEKFEDMGYTSEEAEIAANNREVGLSAYMLGSQKSETAQIANQIAKDNNLSGFDTTHDDTPQFEDLTNGKAFAELNDPIGNQEIAAAKESYIEAKEAYVEAVDTANDSIADAQAAKTQLQETIRSVSRVSGSDQSNWSQEQVDKINEATRKYNDAVIKANQDAANTEKIKATYDLAKDTYLDKKEDYYQSLVDEYLNNQAANNTNSSPTPAPSTGNGQQNNDVSADDFLNLIDSNNGNISV